MSKYLVETFYTCTFKIIHKLDELNEKKLVDLENRKDGKVEIIDVKLNNRKTKAIIRRKKRKIFLGLETIRLKLVQKNHSAMGIINPREMEISQGSSGAHLICH